MTSRESARVLDSRMYAPRGKIPPGRRGMHVCPACGLRRTYRPRCWYCCQLGRGLHARGCGNCRSELSTDPHRLDRIADYERRAAAGLPLFGQRKQLDTQEDT